MLYVISEMQMFKKLPLHILQDSWKLYNRWYRVLDTTELTFSYKVKYMPTFQSNDVEAINFSRNKENFIHNKPTSKLITRLQQNESPETCKRMKHDITQRVYIST